MPRVESHSRAYEQIRANAVLKLREFAHQGREGNVIRPDHAWDAVHKFLAATTALTPPNNQPSWLSSAVDLSKTVALEYKVFKAVFDAAVVFNFEKAERRKRNSPDQDAVERASGDIINLDAHSGYALTKLLQDAVGPEDAEQLGRKWMWLKKNTFFGDLHPGVDVTFFEY